MLVNLLSRKEFERLNDTLLHVALRARGFNNHGSFLESGEDWFVRNVLAPLSPTLCLDVGANFGKYSRLLLEATNSNVICFEPVSSSFQILSDELSDFGERVVLERLGLGEATSRRRVFFNSDSSEHASFSPVVNNISYVNNASSEMSDVITLDQYCRTHGVQSIDLLKIDTEGYEFEVLSGSKEAISRFRPKFVQCEFNLHQLHRQHSMLKFAELLPGYALFQLTPTGMRQRNPRSATSNIFAYSNFVFVREDLALP